MLVVTPVHRLADQLKEVPVALLVLQQLAHASLVGEVVQVLVVTWPDGPAVKLVGHLEGLVLVPLTGGLAGPVLVA